MSYLKKVLLTSFIVYYTVNSPGFESHWEITTLTGLTPLAFLGKLAVGNLPSHGSLTPLCYGFDVTQSLIV